MGFEVEAAGALVTAGLAASEIEGEVGAGTAASGSACANCHTPLSGRFCHSCGQPAVLHHSLLRLGEEVAHGMMRFDAKGWRTIPMLVLHPGKLTRNYIDGQRARYVSPLGLFLFMIFLMFFVFSYTADGINHPATPAEHARAVAKFETHVAGAQADVAAAEKALAKARADHGDIADAESELKDARKDLEQRQRMLASAREAQVKAAAAPANGEAPAVREAPRWTKKVHTGNAKLDAAIIKASQNPDLATYKIKNTAYKFAFLLVPITLPFLWLMFVFRREVTVYDHAVFSLYSLAFMSLLLSVVAACAFFDLSTIAALLFMLVPPAHMFAQMRGTYRLGVWGGLWRTGVMLVVASVVFVLFLLLVLLLSVA
jgi:hypothetical protein